MQEFTFTTPLYNIVFNNDENSNDKGFSLSLSEAISYIKKNNGTDFDYFRDYKGGMVQVVDNESDDVAFEEIVK